MADITNENFRELINLTKETNNLIREDITNESVPDPSKFIKEEASNLLIADANRRSSKKLLSVEESERESDKAKVETEKEQRMALIKEQETTSKAVLMLASNQEMQSKVDDMLASKEAETAEDESKKQGRLSKLMSSIGAGFKDFGQGFKKYTETFKKIPGAGFLMTSLKALGFLALIKIFSDPNLRRDIKSLLKDMVPAIAYVIDRVIVPFAKFIKDMFTGKHPALKKIEDAICDYGPDFLKDSANGIARTMGLLAGALAVGVLFKPFKTLGLLTATGVFTFKKLSGGLTRLAKYFLGLEKGVDKVAKTAKAASSAASVAAGAAGAAGAVPKSKVPTGAPGTFDKKTGRMFGADSKLTTTMKGGKGAAELSKKIQAQAGGADKLSHLKKFPKLMKVAKRLPFFGTLLSAGLLVTTLLDDRVSNDNKVKAVGGVIGGAIGGFGGAKLGALAGAMTGPIGALVGAFGGGIAGFFAGDEIGQMIAEFLMDDKQPERPKVTARGGHARRIQIKRQQAFDVAMAANKGNMNPEVVNMPGRGRGPSPAELAEMRGLPRSNGGAGQGMRPVRDPTQPLPTPPILHAPISHADNSTTNYTTTARSLVNDDPVIAKLSVVK